MLSRDVERNIKPGIKAELARLAYSLLICLAVPFSLILLSVRSYKSRTSARSSQFNRVGLGINTADQGGILLHCVSVGEVVAAAALVKRIQQNSPGTPIYITTTTDTGAQRATQLFGEGIDLFYLPMDLPFFIAPLIRNLAPSCVLITEVELWPNFIHACWKKSIPTYVVNARMTEKSASRYQKIGALFMPMLQKLRGVCAQGERDFNQYARLGMQSEKLHLTNNIKFDRPLSERQDRYLLKTNHSMQERSVLVAGSTHDGEELLCINAYKHLKQTFADLVLVLVPRHPQRFDKVFQLCIEQKLKVTRFTTSTQCEDNTDIFLIDAMGQLDYFYQLANLAFVGGSINPRGGHNALEPAAYGIPIMMGASRYNNPVICEALAEAGALALTNTFDQLVNTCDNWLSDPNKAEQAGENGRQVIKNNQGAVSATLAVIGYD